MESKDCQALILAPTRELAQQVCLTTRRCDILMFSSGNHLDPEGSIGTR